MTTRCYEARFLLFANARGAGTLFTAKYPVPAWNSSCIKCPEFSWGDARSWNWLAHNILSSFATVLSVMSRPDFQVTSLVTLSRISLYRALVFCCSSDNKLGHTLASPFKLRFRKLPVKKTKRSLKRIKLWDINTEIEELLVYNLFIPQVESFCRPLKLGQRTDSQKYI